MTKAAYGLDLLAALDSACRARLTRLKVDRSGGRKKGEGSDGDGGEAREHHRDRVERGVGELSAVGNAG